MRIVDVHPSWRALPHASFQLIAVQFLLGVHFRFQLQFGLGRSIFQLIAVQFIWKEAVADHARHRGFRPGHDEYGSIHMVPRGAEGDCDRICPMFVFAKCDGALRGLQAAPASHNWVALSVPQCSPELLVSLFVYWNLRGVDAPMFPSSPQASPGQADRRSLPSRRCISISTFGSYVRTGGWSPALKLFMGSCRTSRRAWQQIAFATSSSALTCAAGLASPHRTPNSKIRQRSSPNGGTETSGIARSSSASVSLTRTASRSRPGCVPKASEGQVGMAKSECNSYGPNVGHRCCGCSPSQGIGTTLSKQSRGGTPHRT